jgi:hypothetical protein
MARSTAEIQADIAVTRRLIEGQLDGLRRRLPDRWWVPYAVLAGALVTGVVISRIPVFKLVGTGARAVQTGLTVASTVAAVDRFIAERPARRRAA